jgi:hypothetical protein
VETRWGHLASSIALPSRTGLSQVHSSRLDDHTHAVRTHRPSSRRLGAERARARWRTRSTLAYRHRVPHVWKWLAPHASTIAPPRWARTVRARGGLERSEPTRDAAREAHWRSGIVIASARLAVARSPRFDDRAAPLGTHRPSSSPLEPSEPRPRVIDRHQRRPRPSSFTYSVVRTNRESRSCCAPLGTRRLAVGPREHEVRRSAFDP